MAESLTSLMKRSLEAGVPQRYVFLFSEIYEQIKNLDDVFLKLTPTDKDRSLSHIEDTLITMKVYTRKEIPFTLLGRLVKLRSVIEAVFGRMIQTAIIQRRKREAEATMHQTPSNPSQRPKSRP